MLLLYVLDYSGLRINVDLIGVRYDCPPFPLE